MSEQFTSNDWGGWVLDLGRGTFTHQRGHYAVDFDRLLTPEDVVFWVFQLNGKGWGVEALPGFVMALDDVLEPQRKRNQPFTAETIRAEIDAFIKSPGISVTRR